MAESNQHLLEVEYRLLQEHVQFLMEQRMKIFDLYGKIVLIPAAVTSYLGISASVDAANSPSLGSHLSPDCAAWVLYGLTVTALCLYIYYCLVTLASSEYFADIKLIRKHVSDKLGIESLLLTRSGLTPKARGLLDRAGDYVPFFRGMAFASLTSLIATLAVFIQLANPWIAFVVYAMLIGLHWGIYSLLMSDVTPTSAFRHAWILLKRKWQ